MKSLTSFSILLFSLLVGTYSYCQSNKIDTAHVENPFKTGLNGHIDMYNSQNPIEKVYLHTDKDIVSSGEDIWYSAYLVMGPTHGYSLASKLLHVDLISPKNEIIVSQTLKISNGRGQGSMQIPNDLSAGDYQLRSYTNWMRNFDQEFFFVKTIKILNSDTSSNLIPILKDKIDLQFFPEGGHLVDGLTSRVAFKAIGSDGLGKKVEGKVVDSRGKIVGDLNAIARGSGIFYLQPKSTEQYTAVLDDGSKYSLPKVQNEGYTISIGRKNPDKITVQVQVSALMKKRPFYVIGLVRGQRYFHGKFEFEGEPLVKFEIPTKEIPSGVLMLTLFDEEKKPWCERLVFVNNKEKLNITAKVRDKNFNKRNEIILDIAVKDSTGLPVSSELSISVTDKGQLVKDVNSANILTHLLLQSDLRGHVSQPALLFKDRSRATLYELDLVMLTHGWRKYNWQAIWDGINTPNVFSFSEGLTISGIANGLNDRPLRNTSFKIIAQSEKELAAYTFKTDGYGKFLVNDFDISGATDIVFNAYDSENKLLDAKVVLDSSKIVLPMPQFDSYAYNGHKYVEDNYLEFSSVRKRLDSLYYRTIKLDEVSVTSDRIEKRQPATPSTYGITPDKAIYAADHPYSLNVIDLINKIPGIFLTRSVVSATARGGGPLWVIDGFPIHQPGSKDSIVGGNIAEAISGVPSAINHIDINSIERVEFLRPWSASIYGVRGSKGVFLIYTKNGKDLPSRRVLSPKFKIWGHSRAKEFYSPKYDIKLGMDDIPDYRSTLYWNPLLITDKKGKATIRFFNSDNANHIQIAIEGLSSFGVPGTCLQTLGEDQL